MKAPLADIVIPVFNGEGHLSECLNSVIEQSYTRWRVTIINNCSTDKTAQISDDFATADERIKVRHFDRFVSQTENYNRAAASISRDSQYAVVLEADNRLQKGFLEKTIALAEREDGVGLVGTYYFKKSGVFGGGLPYEQSRLSGREAGRLLLLSSLWLGPPTTVLFRTKALLDRDPVFRNGLPYDDWELYLDVFRLWDLGFIHESLSHVRDDRDTTHGTLDRFDLSPAMRFFLSERYAAEFMKDKDAVSHRHRMRRNYYMAMSKSLFAGRATKPYADFHRNLFKAESVTPSRTQFFLSAADSILNILFNPKRTFEKLGEAIAKKLKGKYTHLYF